MVLWDSYFKMEEEHEEFLIYMLKKQGENTAQLKADSIRQYDRNVRSR